MKQNYVTKTKLKKHYDNNVKHLSLLILKISFLTLIGCLVKQAQDNNLYMVRWIGPVLLTPKTYDNHMCVR